MLRDFNILATTSRGYENAACSELQYLLEQIGEESPTIDRTGISGLIVAKTTQDPFKIIENFRKILQKRPYEFRYMLRVIPIEKVVRTDLNEIQNTVMSLGSKIEETETFRITVEKRFTGTSTREIIEAAAANIKRKVDLSKPHKILLVEIVGGLTGISVMKPEDILSVMKEKVL